MKPWQCEVGDFVEFYVSEWAKLQEKATLKGTIVSRACKLAEIEMVDKNKKMTVHVSLINILKAVPRVKLLARKFDEKPSNKKGKAVLKEVTHEVGEMKFQYKKKK
jgi:hypothetical protein